MMRLRKYVHALALATLCAIAIRCGNSNSPTQPTPEPPPPVRTTAVLVGAADIADCGNDSGRHAEDTARLLDSIEGTVFAAGDLAYFHGTQQEFSNCYDPRWGRHRRRTRPSPGNHEYETAGAIPYYNYFGDAAGPFGSGFYSYDLGNWHVVSLNSNIASTPGSEQWIWLREDLAANRATKCTVAYFHHPRFTSGPNFGGPNVMADVWQVLYDFKVEIVLNGHDHFYERFGEQDPTGRRAPDGIRQFVVGTGGAMLYPQVGARKPNSDFLQLGTYGVLKLTLHPETYEWSFIEAVTARQLDFGQGACH